MEKSIVTTGKTIDLAVAAALEQLGLDRDSISVTQVLENPKSGFLGFNSSPAKIKATYEVPDEAEPSQPPQEPTPALSSASRSKPKRFEPKQEKKPAVQEPVQPGKPAAPASRRSPGPKGRPV